MKYSGNNKPLVCMQTNSTCYKGTWTMIPKGVLWHSTGANNKKVSRYVQPSDNAADREELLKILGKNKYGNDWNHAYRTAGLNCWIGELADGSVATVQTMPWNYRPWGCGEGTKGSCNDGWIQFEICEDSLTDKKYFEKVYKEAVEITAYLCKLYNIDPKGHVAHNGVKVPTILCHADAHKLKLGSNHGDVLYWFKKHGKTMDDVRNDVNLFLHGSTVFEPVVTAPSFASYKVRVTTDSLNIRSKATINSAVVGVLNKGDIVTITDKSDIWEKTSKGWISSNYTEKVQENAAQAFNVGDVVKLSSNAKYYSGKDIPPWVKEKTWIVKSVSGDRIVIDMSADGKESICSPVNAKYLTVVKLADTKFKPYKVKVSVDVLNIRKDAGTNYGIVGSIKEGEIYTIVNEANGKGATKWGQLKSGQGWISLDYVKKV